MEVSPFTHLPAELVWLIGDLVQATSPPSLIACSLVSRRWRSLTARVLFRNVKITIAKESDMEGQVQKCATVLGALSCLEHIRRLTVDVLPDRDREELLLLGLDSQLTESAYEQDDSWKPLANFMKGLPSLADLVFSCHAQLPPCILEALHLHKPRCRLHMPKFWFQSLEHPKIDDHELALATSPCLHSVTAHYDPRRHPQLPRVDDVFMKLANGLAPNLKEMRLTVGSDAHLLHGDEDIHPVDTLPWWGLSSKDFETRKIVEPLTFFKLRNFDMVSPGYLTRWRRSISFSSLRTLKIWCYLVDEALDFLENCESLSSLDCLSLMLSPPPGLKSRYRDVNYCPSSYPENSYRVIENFIRQVMPLSSLGFGGVCVQSLGLGPVHEALKTNGDRLRSLSLCRWTWYRRDFSSTVSQRVLDSDEIELLVRYCPNLEDLKIAVKRSRGSTDEAKRYQLLGNFPRLRSLSVILDASAIRCANFSPSDPNPSGYDDKWERQLWSPQSYCLGMIFRGQVCDVLINGALDGKLSRQIFDTIVSGKPRSHNTLPLERLKLHVDTAIDFGSGYTHPLARLAPFAFTGIANLAEVARTIGQSWQVTADWPASMSPMDPSEHVRLDVQRIPMSPASGEGEENYAVIDPYLETVFRRLWPESSGDWRKDWHSFPLEELSKGNE